MAKQNKGNKTGKGGFADNPQNRNPGGRPKNRDSITYWATLFINMTEKEFKDWPKKTKDKDRTVAEAIAYRLVHRSTNSLKDFKELLDRVEGKAMQSIDMTSQGQSISPFTEEQKKRIAKRIIDGK